MRFGIKGNGTTKRVTLALLAGGLLAMGVADVLAGPNDFNRLKKDQSDIKKDGHDPTGPGREALQKPEEAYKSLPTSPAGNGVDWVEALRDGSIDPRWKKGDAEAAPTVMDVNIVREVKGSMPDVVYPHKQHTQWLTCSNCHPKIFVPKKGGNQISMAQNLMGKKCGVCHGKVAFPFSQCMRCHSGAPDKGKQAKVKKEGEQ